MDHRISLAHDVSRVRRLANRLLEAQLAQHGMPDLVPSHGDILNTLFNEGPVTMSGLSRYIGRDPSTVTALVKKLVRLGLAQTQRCPTDGRTVVVSLTERGDSARRDFEEISALLQSTWRSGISEEDFDTTSRVLCTVAENLEQAIASSERAPDEHSSCERAPCAATDEPAEPAVV